IDTMLRDPLVGVGPFHWHLIVTKRYNWPVAQEAHSLWLQTGAEYGIPGITFLVLFYATSAGGCAVALRQLERNSPRKLPALDVPLARGVIAGLVGFAVSAQFVSVQFLEIPIYVALVGAGVLKLGKPPEKGADKGAPSVWRRVRPAAGPPRPP